MILGVIEAQPRLELSNPALLLLTEGCLHESMSYAWPVGMTPSDGSCIDQLP
jgi:hypothetical protein